MFPIRDHNPSTITPWVTIALIVANVAVWLWGLGTIQSDRALYELYDTYAMIPARLSSGDGWLTLVTSIFLHAGFMHLFGNMLFLWIFGDNLEEELGHLGFLGFYLACGIGAGLGQWLSGPFSTIPTVGASGAIAGVMGAYLLFFPRARVDILLILIVFFRVIPVPAWLMLGLWFLLQLVGGAGSDTSAGGVAYWAHAGGFVVGLGLVLPLWLRRGGPVYWRRTHGRPPHPEARYQVARSTIPTVRRRR